MTTTRYVTLSFQHDQQVIFEAFQQYEPEFDSPYFQGSVSLVGDFDPDWYLSDNPNFDDTEIHFDWECLSCKCWGSIITYLDNRDELSSIRQITGIQSVTEDLYVVHLAS